MANASKIIYGNKVLIDLTSDTVEASKLAKGITAHDKSGNTITGTNDFDANTTDATATASEILDTKTAYVNGVKVTGTMPNRGAVTGTLSDISDTYTIQNGYHDGSGRVSIDSTEKAKVIPGNIKQGVSILGVEGTYEGEAVPTQKKTVSPYTTPQTILPDVGYDLSQVDVEAIYYDETNNAAGGLTVTIGKVKPS